MATYSRILVPVDFSDSSQVAMSKACDLARDFDAEVHLLHVVEFVSAVHHPMTQLGPLHQQVLFQLKAAATEELQKLPPTEFGPKRVVRAVRTGHPTSEIAAYAREKGMDLIVMGTHGRTGVSHFMLGSVAERVVRVAHCPVLVVPTGRTPESSVTAAQSA
jgi:nucleotide-binding universal stress UspA family protein